jgi:hypothetical protein
MKNIIYSIIVLFSLSIINCQLLDAEVTVDKKKLIILTNENETNEIADRIYQMASSSATQLKRYEVMDRNFLEDVLKEQKLQHSGIVDNDKAVEIGKIVTADEALLINMQMFEQKGIPPKEKDRDDEETSEKIGLVGWVIKEVVKAEISKATADVEKYPNNIQTIIDCQVILINVENGKSIDSFDIHSEYVGGNKSKSLSQTFKQVQSQMVNKLKEIYKLSSEVLDVQGNGITLLLGKNMGVDSNSIFEIISRDERKTIRDREITIPGNSVGLVKVDLVSNDASKASVLRKWNEIKPGYQAHEVTGQVFSRGMTGVYGKDPDHMRLRFFVQINPFGVFGGDIHGDIGLTQDTRGRDDFQFGFGGSFNLRLIKKPSFTLGPTLSIPIDFHTRRDDESPEGKSHWVFLPIISPRIGIQTEVMLSSKTDIIIRFEYVLSSASSKYWTYSEKQEDDEDESESTTWNAYWNQNVGVVPEINYEGWIITLGFRKVSFPSFSFN